MNFKKPFFGLLFFFVLLKTGTVFGQYVPLAEQKANFVYKFPMFLIYENDDFIDRITIGVLDGSDEFLRELRKKTRKSYPNGVTIEVVNFNSISEITPTHLLFVEESKNKQVPQILERIKGRSTALVTENYPVTKDIMINLVLDKTGQITFEFIRQNLRKMNISVVPEISVLGGLDIDVKDLFDVAQKDLEDEKKKVEIQRAMIENQKKELAEQTIKLEKKNKEIAEAEKRLEESLRELNLKKADLEIIKTQLETKNKILNEQGERIRIQQDEIKQQQQIAEKMNRELVAKSKDIELADKALEQKKNEMAALNITIAIQRQLIYIFIGFFIIISVLLFFIVRQYRIKRKDNIKLAQQKNEIERQAFELEAINVELEKLSIVASETSSAVAILDQSGNFVWINAGFTRLYGYTLQLLKNELDENIIRASTHPKIREIIDTCINEKRPVIYETFIKTRSGSRKWAQTTLSPIIDTDNVVSKLVLIDSDITRIKEAEEEIRRQNEMILTQSRELETKNIELEKLSLVAAKTDNSVIIADPTGEIEWVNEGFTRLLGITWEQFKDEYGSNLLETSLNPDILDVIEKGLSEKKSVVYTSKTITKANRLIWIQTTLTPIFDNDGNLRKLVAIDVDVTKIKLAEEEIAKQKQKITDSILYAGRIQSAILPPFDYIKDIFPNNFILFKPRDIVSGDFYWAYRVENKRFFSAADCTGHGVPGAFMSMLGMTCLNEIVNTKDINTITPNLILNQLRDFIKKALRQTGKEGEAKDGMDIALCMIDDTTSTLHYAGAHNPIIIIRNQEPIQIDADEMPIGIYYNEKESFTNHEIPMLPNDMYYVFSDGFADQFGGPKGRKYMLKRFREDLVKISVLPLQEQHDYLNNSITDWKGERPQLDDILVIGVRN